MPSETNQKNHYEFLGVHPKASIAAIRKAYYNAARTYHPDKHPQDPESQKKAEEIFKKANEAYECLSDPKSRLIYDEELAATRPNTVKDDLIKLEEDEEIALFRIMKNTTITNEEKWQQLKGFFTHYGESLLSTVLSSGEALSHTKDLEISVPGAASKQFDLSFKDDETGHTLFDYATHTYIKNPSPTQRQAFGTAIHDTHPDANIAELLLERGYDASAPRYATSAFQTLFEVGGGSYANLEKYLSDNTSFPHLREIITTYGFTWTPQYVKLLLDSDIPPELYMHWEDNLKAPMTPFYLILLHYLNPPTNHLITEKPLDDFISKFIEIAKTKKQLNHPTEDGKTLLQFILATRAAGHKKEEKIKFLKDLFAAGANPLLKDNMGNNALHVYCQSPGNAPGIGELLLRPPHNMSPNEQNYEGSTPLHLALMNFNKPKLTDEEFNHTITLIRQLLARGANFQIANNAGKTALDYAIELEQKTVVHLFLQKAIEIPNLNAVKQIAESTSRDVLFYHDDTGINPLRYAENIIEKQQSEVGREIVAYLKQQGVPDQPREAAAAAGEPLKVPLDETSKLQNRIAGLEQLISHFEETYLQGVKETTDPTRVAAKKLISDLKIDATKAELQDKIKKLQDAIKQLQDSELECFKEKHHLRNHTADLAYWHQQVRFWGGKKITYPMMNNKGEMAVVPPTTVPHGIAMAYQIINNNKLPNAEKLNELSQLDFTHQARHSPFTLFATRWTRTETTRKCYQDLQNIGKLLKLK